MIEGCERRPNAARLRALSTLLAQDTHLTDVGRVILDRLFAQNAVEADRYLSATTAGYREAYREALMRAILRGEGAEGEFVGGGCDGGGS